ncbi:AAA family ATPase, partial [Candidatus Pacearchaeota archaeon]|nr:AAA family ATPase [Candidatus Pacearchaeota archaeon]
MILKKILLKNIRSYEAQEIEFKEGSVLLSGDIGSGKTSILLSIEFALFGLQPGQRGSALLRNGEKEGGVSIEFEVDGKNVLIERTLKKGKAISQDYASITIDGDKQEIAVTELKSKVLNLLNYPKEFSKKQNLLYKFTVYTPQEEMKEIILQDSETRINALRHIFGIDKYKRIIENGLVLALKIREEKRIKEAMTSAFEQDKLNLLSKKDEFKSKLQEISVVEGELIIKKDITKKIQEQLQEVLKKRDEKLKFQQEIEKTKIMVLTKNSLISENKKIIEQLKSQVAEVMRSNKDIDILKIEQINKTIALLKKEKKEFESLVLEIKSKINSLNIKNQEDERIKERLTHIEICPTCMQDVNATYKKNVLNKINASAIKNLQLINEFILQESKISNETAELEKNISLNERQIQEINILKVKMQGVEEKQKRIQEIEKSNIFLNKDLELLDKQLSLLKTSILELNKFENIYKEKQDRLDEAARQEKLTEIKIAELKKETSFFSKQIDELMERIKQTELIKEQVNYLTDLESWISKEFILLVSSIEKNIMNKLKLEFSKLFSEWFSMLVSDTFNVSLDDSFTPIVEFQDYIIDYNYLSGGERTAIALAYRLALNQVLNSFLSNIKTKGFIILDEPTDGFSDQ